MRIRGELYSEKCSHEHITRKGKKWKTKLKFKTKEEAEDYIKKYNINKVAYLCSWCNNWHIGSKDDKNNL